MQRPSFSNCAAALLLSALAPAFAFSIWMGDALFAPLTFAIALGHALILGLPLFIHFHRRGWFSLLSATLVSIAIGCLPVGLLTFPLSFWGDGSSSVNGVPLVVDGIPTWAGWVDYFGFILYAAAFGALGGATFWLTLSLTERGSARIRFNWMKGMPALALVLVGVAAAVLSWTPAENHKDDSCHNMFRDGRRSVTPKVRMSLLIERGEIPRLVEIFDAIGRKHQMALRNRSETRPDVVEITSLSLCNERGLNIIIHSQKWARMEAPQILGSGIPITVYELREDSGRDQVVTDLAATLEAEWPGSLTFEDAYGNVQKP